MMNEDTKHKVEARLKRVAGQVAGIQRMVDEDRYCVDVLLQISAARAALHKVGKVMLQSHIETCVQGPLGLFPYQLFAPTHEAPYPAPPATFGPGELPRARLRAADRRGPRSPSASLAGRMVWRRTSARRGGASPVRATGSESRGRADWQSGSAECGTARRHSRGPAHTRHHDSAGDARRRDGRFRAPAIAARRRHPGRGMS